MDAAEQGGFAGLYRSLGALEAGVRHSEAVSLPARDPAPYDADAAGTRFDAAGLSRARRHIAAARAGVGGAAAAEAALDADLVDRVFRLATAVLREGASSASKEDLGRRMEAFARAVAALRRQLEPPHGASSVPDPGRAIPDRPDSSLASRSDIDGGVAEALRLLEAVRESAVAQARQVALRIDAAADRARAVRGEVSLPEPPRLAAELVDRIDAVDASGAEARGMGGVEALRAGFDEGMLAFTTGFAPLRDAAETVGAKVLAAQAAAGDIGAAP